MIKFQKLIGFSQISESNKFVFIFRYLYFKMHKKQIISDNKVEIHHLENLETNGELRIGIENTGFATKHDRTLLRLKGKLKFNGNFSIGKGCKFDIAENGYVEIGKSGYAIGFSNFIISYGLKIGDNCAISWGCQFLDNDFHAFDYPERKETNHQNNIIIGDNVWIGCNTFIYKGVNIPNGCIIASNSVVKSSFTEENVLIAGNPAKVTKQSVTWKN